MPIPVIIITLISLALIASGLILNEWTSGNKASLARKSARRHMRWRLILKKYENSNGTIPDGIIRLFLNPENLAAFADVAFESVESLSAAFGILYRNERAFCSLFGSASDDLRSFFAYTISTFQITDKEHNAVYKKTMLSYLTKDSVYLRQNALLAIYSFGDEALVIDAFHTINKKRFYHNERLLADGLLTFTGDKILLSRCLMNVFDSFDKHCKIAIINFMRYAEIHDHDERFMEMACNEETDTDIRCAAIRLFAKKPGKKVNKVLIKIINSCANSDVWEPASVAASALGDYDDHDGNNEAIDCLLESIHSKWWYVRINSSKSLSKLRISQNKIKELEASKDAFAMEELSYAIDELQMALDRGI
jgi:hypothetical protein